MLDKNNNIRVIDLGLVHSSAADSITTLILNRLLQDGDLENGISPNFLLRNWPPAFVEWSTKAVRDAFFASPIFPRLLNPEIIKETISRGVINGYLAYVGKISDGNYEPFLYKSELAANEVEISDDMFIISKDNAEAFIKRKEEQNKPKVVIDKPNVDSKPDDIIKPGVNDDNGAKIEQQSFHRISWNGEISTQKWMNFYTKVLSKYAIGNNLVIRLNVEIMNQEGISFQKIEETKLSLRELGFNDDIETD